MASVVQKGKSNPQKKKNQKKLVQKWNRALTSNIVVQVEEIL